VTPAEEARTQIDYHRATSSSALAWVEVGRWTGSTQLTRERYKYDDFGRLVEQRRLMPDGTESVRQTAYNAMGWKVSESEAGTGAPGGFTQYLVYDPFGRPGIIRPPEGSVHDVRLYYSGVRKVDRTFSLGTELGAVPAGGDRGGPRRDPAGQHGDLRPPGAAVQAQGALQPRRLHGDHDLPLRRQRGDEPGRAGDGVGDPEPLLHGRRPGVPARRDPPGERHRHLLAVRLAGARRAARRRDAGGFRLPMTLSTARRSGAAPWPSAVCAEVVDSVGHRAVWR
jgi:YD repeat-containing protein